MKVNKILNFLNTARLLRRVNKLSILENGIIEEREELLETIRLLSRRLSLPISHYCTMTVQSNKGVQLLHRILFLSNGDQHISEAIFEVFALLLSHDRKMNKTHTAISIHISGEKLLEDIIEIHHEDDTLRALGKIIMKELQESSAAASLEKIGHVKRALDLGISNIVYKKVFPSAEVCSDNTESVELVLTEMKKHIDNENVQVKGLEVLYKCLDDAECISDFFSCDNFLSIFISAISSKQIHRQRLALSILLTLSCEQHLCERLSAEDDISTLFQLLVVGDNFPQTLKQILLWTLTNLVAEGKKETPGFALSMLFVSSPLGLKHR